MISTLIGIKRLNQTIFLGEFWTRSLILCRIPLEDRSGNIYILKLEHFWISIIGDHQFRQIWGVVNGQISQLSGQIEPLIGYFVQF